MGLKRAGAAGDSPTLGQPLEGAIDMQKVPEPRHDTPFLRADAEPRAIADVLAELLRVLVMWGGLNIAEDQIQEHAANGILALIGAYDVSAPNTSGCHRG